MAGQGLDIGKLKRVEAVLEKNLSEPDFATNPHEYMNHWLRHEEHPEGYEACVAAALGTDLQELNAESLAAVHDLYAPSVMLHSDPGVIGWDWYNIPDPNQDMIDDDGVFESTSARMAREANERAVADAYRRSESLKNYLKANPDGGAPRPWLRWAKL